MYERVAALRQGDEASELHGVPIVLVTRGMERRATAPILAALARSTAAVGYTGSGVILQHLAPGQDVAEGGLANTGFSVKLDFPQVAPIKSVK